ncbi:type II toxin-antitoxin system RelE/ParE family toxin [Omnitrophica bacterium]|nr:type II toxin-antitoxin system RelE/ParE family toxin [Candidatus Omnitrophota bacterium]
MNMAYKLLYHPAVLKDLRKVPSDAKSRIREAIETRLLEDPVSRGKPLRQSLKGHRKFRVGDWRVIYRIDRSTIIILKIGHRREVYQDAASRV